MKTSSLKYSLAFWMLLSECYCLSFTCLLQRLRSIFRWIRVVICHLCFDAQHYSFLLRCSRIRETTHCFSLMIFCYWFAQLTNPRQCHCLSLWSLDRWCWLLLFSWVVLFFNYFKLTLLVRALTFIFNLTIVLVFFFWQDRCVFDLTYVFYRFLFFLNFTFVNCWCKLQFMFARSSLNDALLNWWLFIRGLDVTSLIDRLVGCQNLAFTFVLLFASTLLFTFDALWASRLHRLCRFLRLLRLPWRLWRHRSRTLPCNSSWWFFITFLFAFKRPLRLQLFDVLLPFLLLLLPFLVAALPSGFSFLSAFLVASLLLVVVGPKGDLAWSIFTLDGLAGLIWLLLLFTDLMTFTFSIVTLTLAVHPDVLR